MAICTVANETFCEPIVVERLSLNVRYMGNYLLAVIYHSQTQLQCELTMCVHDDLICKQLVIHLVLGAVSWRQIKIHHTIANAFAGASLTYGFRYLYLQLITASCIFSQTTHT